MSAGLGAAKSTVNSWGMATTGEADTSSHDWVADMQEKGKREAAARVIQTTYRRKAKKSEGDASDSGSPSAEGED